MFVGFCVFVCLCLCLLLGWWVGLCCVVLFVCGVVFVVLFLTCRAGCYRHSKQVFMLGYAEPMLCEVLESSDPWRKFCGGSWNFASAAPSLSRWSRAIGDHGSLDHQGISYHMSTQIYIYIYIYNGVV